MFFFSSSLLYVQWKLHEIFLKLLIHSFINILHIEVRTREQLIGKHRGERVRKRKEILQGVFNKQR